MKESYLTSLLRLRLLVGFLGERAQFAWWPTAFYEPSSRSFLQPVFTKTMKLAQYHGVVEAARRLHDEHLNVGTYHLFRLPEEVEQDLHSIVQLEVGARVRDPMSNKGAALQELQDMSDDASPPGIGPISVGHIEKLASAAVLKSIASAYFAAFSANQRVFPYLMR